MPPRRRYAFRGGGVTIEEYDEEDEHDYDDEEAADTEDEEEEEEEDEDDTEEEEEEDEERQTRVHTSVSHTPRVSQDEKEKQIRSEGVCSTSGSQEEDAAWKPSEAEGISCLICMEVWTNDGEHQVWYTLDSTDCVNNFMPSI